jgi:hypothetical protein
LPASFPKRDKDLSKSISGTYFSLRTGLAFLAFAFPLLLLLGGSFAKVPIQGSMSAYYHATLHALPDHPTGQEVMRGPICWHPFRVKNSRLLGVIVGSFLTGAKITGLYDHPLITRYLSQFTF